MPVLHLHFIYKAVGLNLHHPYSPLCQLLLHLCGSFEALFFWLLSLMVRKQRIKVSSFVQDELRLGRSSRFGWQHLFHAFGAKKTVAVGQQQR